MNTPIGNITLPNIGSTWPMATTANVPDDGRVRMTPESLDIHRLVKQWFQTATLDDIWEVGKEQLTKRQDLRLYGKRAVLRVQQARQKQEKRGRKPYYPTGWMVLR